LLISRFGGEKAKEFSELASVLRVFVNAEFQILAKRLIEFGEVILVLGDLAEDVHAFLDNIFADDFQDLVLLERLTGDVERKILRVDDAFDKVEVFGYKILAIVHDEDAADIEFDVIALLLAFKKVERCAEEGVKKCENMWEPRGFTVWERRG
jgi:hypothetical protein